MEIEMSNSIPLWGIISVIGAGFYFIWQMKMETMLTVRRMDAIEKAYDKIADKLDIIDGDIKELNKKVH